MQLRDELQGRLVVVTNGMYFWRCLLYFLARNGLPTNPITLQAMEGLRDLLKQGMDLGYDLFFDWLDIVGKAVTMVSHLPLSLCRALLPLLRGCGGEGGTLWLSEKSPSVSYFPSGWWWWCVCMGSSLFCVYGCTPAVEDGARTQNLDIREISRVVHFVRTALGVNADDFLVYFRDRRWKMPSEVRLFKAKLEQDRGNQFNMYM